MATQYHNLSAYDVNEFPSREDIAEERFAIIVADWNSNITGALLDGAYATLLQQGVLEKNIHVSHVPGTFELTFAAKQLLKMKYDAVIVLGCVVQGDTPHLDFVCQGVTQGVAALNARPDSEIPVIFGVLTTGTMQQALDRAGGIHGNKGVEAAVTAIKMANFK